MSKPGIKGQKTLREHLAYAYANLGRADAALKKGETKYRVVHHMIRAKLYKGLVTGTLSLGSIFDDERLKLMRSPRCSYCDSTEHLALDHLIPKARGAGDWPENLVLACRSCNSSKRDRDCVSWLVSRGEFPDLMLLRRYLKLAFMLGEEYKCLDLILSESAVRALPFDVDIYPLRFPELDKLRL